MLRVVGEGSPYLLIAPCSQKHLPERERFTGSNQVMTALDLDLERGGGCNNATVTIVAIMCVAAVFTAPATLPLDHLGLEAHLTAVAPLVAPPPLPESVGHGDNDRTTQAQQPRQYTIKDSQTHNRYQGLALLCL